MTGPEARVLPGSQHRSGAEFSTNGSAETPFAKRAGTYDPYSVHLPSSACCMAPAQELPCYPKRVHSVCVCVCVGVGGGVRAKAEEGKINQILQEVWCVCHSHCHMFLHQQHRAQGRTRNWDLIQH